MPLQVLVLGTLLLIGGAGFAFMGDRRFLAYLPVWGAVAGFVAGAELVTAFAGDAFLGTPAGWIAGAVVAVACGLLSLESWWGPITIGAGSVGWIVGAGVASGLGIGSGILLVAAGLAGAVVLGAVANALETPRPLVVLLSSVGGGSAMGAGASLLLAWAPVDRLAGHALAVVVNGGAVAIVATATLMALAAAFQLTIARDAADEVQRELSRRRA